MKRRKDIALEKLHAYLPGKYIYLGEGAEGVVFTDKRWVYKIYHLSSKEKLVSLHLHKEALYDAIHLYPIKDIVSFQNVQILIYPYEESEPVVVLKDDIISCLVELWQRRLIVRNIKPSNFVRVKEILKLIDLDFHPYTDNDFLNMCARSYIYIKYANKDKVTLNKIVRSTINNFDIPELDGFQCFMNKVFSSVVYNDSLSAIETMQKVHTSLNKEHSEIVPFTQSNNIDTFFFKKISEGLYLDSFITRKIELNGNNYFEPQEIEYNFHAIKPFRKAVSLVIKTCLQDCETIYANVKHIVKQLSSPETFVEKIISVDFREKNFLREFYTSGSMEVLLGQIQQLIDEKVVDRYILLNPQESVGLNRRWFNIDTDATHTSIGAPVSSQIYAFEQAHGEYVFQMDSDVMIARKDLNHSFLEDMVSEMERNTKVVSVGFNICQNSAVLFKPYHGFEDGGFVPEVRMGLFHKERLISLLPLTNKIDQYGNWTTTWFRALHQKQKETGYCSIRGGDSRSFFIHPQNYRKTNADVWTTILDRVESLCIPTCQQNEFDCMGSYYDWTLPKREEDLIVVCLVHNVEYARFLKMFSSIISQRYEKWGMIIIDDASTNGLSFFIEGIIRPYLSRITFIKNRIRQGGMANTYKAIHYFVSNPNAVIMTVDGDDAIIGNGVFGEVMRKFQVESADVVVGGMYQTYRLQAHYRYPVDFYQPRKNGGNVWQHLRAFKKYLFDSLDITDLKQRNATDTPFVIKREISNDWMENCSDYAMMVPIVEMSSNPMHMDHIVYYHDRERTPSEIQNVKERCIADILNKQRKNCSFVQIGRKTFHPNFSKIEIDITYECNLNCIACNRSCSQFPTTERVDLSDIDKFIEESISLNKRWGIVNILGGEPTLHPDFEQIVELLVNKYIIPFSSETFLQIVSNGWTDESRMLLERVRKLPHVYIDYKSFKTSSKNEYFSPFNDAPLDDIYFANADYKKACWVPAYCGIGLNKFGYYGCSVCGAIDRVLNAENRVGVPRLKEVTLEIMQQQFDLFCRYCGNYKDYEINRGDFIPRCEKAPLRANSVSASWKRLYR